MGEGSATVTSADPDAGAGAGGGAAAPGVAAACHSTETDKLKMVKTPAAAFKQESTTVSAPRRNNRQSTAIPNGHIHITKS